MPSLIRWGGQVGVVGPGGCASVTGRSQAPARAHLREGGAAAGTDERGNVLFMVWKTTYTRRFRKWEASDQTYMGKMTTNAYAANLGFIETMQFPVTMVLHI